MPAYIQSGEVFTTSAPGNAVTAARLNNAINSLTILPAFISTQPDVAPIGTDKVLMFQISGNQFIAPTLNEFSSAQLADAAATIPSLRSLGYTGNKAAPGFGTPGLANGNIFTNTNQFAHVGGTIGVTVNVNAVDTTGAGATAVASLVAGSTDLYGRISFTPGGVPGPNVLMLTVQFHTAFAAVPFVNLIAYNFAALTAQQNTKQMSVVASATNFSVFSGAAAPVAGTVYTYNYTVLGL